MCIRDSRVSEHSVATESLKKTLDEQTARMKMCIRDRDGAEAFADMTVNLPGYSLDPGEAFISGDISKDLLRFIKENKLGKVLPYQDVYKRQFIEG